MSLCHSCSSCTCNGWGKKNPSLSSRGVGGSRSLGSQPLCYCGEKSVLRTAKTVKNRGKQFWGCSKYKSGNEDGGCNYFKWWTEDGIEQIGNSENCEGRGEIMVKTEESDGDRKTIIKLEKSVAIFEKWMKVLIGMVIFVCVVNVIVLSVLIKNA